MVTSQSVAQVSDTVNSFISSIYLFIYFLLNVKVYIVMNIEEQIQSEHEALDMRQKRVHVRVHVRVVKSHTRTHTVKALLPGVLVQLNVSV